MIADIRYGDYTGALHLLQDGADPNTAELLNLNEPLFGHVVHLITGSARKQEKGLSALDVLFIPEREYDDHLILGTMAPARFAILRFLVTHGADIHRKSFWDMDGGETPLASYAAHWEYSDCLKLLIEHGADVNSTNTFGDSLLMMAVDPYRERDPAQVRTVRLLLERGADPKHKNCNGDTALSYAESINDRAIVLLIKKYWR